MLALASPTCVNAQTSVADGIRDKVATYVKDVLQDDLKSASRNKARASQLSVSLTILKPGAQLTDQTCTRRLAKDFPEQIRDLQKAAGLTMEVRPPGHDASVVIVMGDTVGLKVDPLEAPFTAWDQVARERSKVELVSLSLNASLVDAPITHRRWGLYEVADRSMVHGTSVIDWDAPLMSDDCKLSFAREVVFLYSLGLNELVTHDSRYAAFRQSLFDLPTPGRSATDPSERTLPVADGDLVWANIFCWQAHGWDSIDVEAAQKDVASCARRMEKIISD